MQLAEDAWNSKDPARVSLAYTQDTEWRNRSEFVNGREDVVKFLSGKWKKELNQFRAYGNENWESDENGLMQKGLPALTTLQ